MSQSPQKLKVTCPGCAKQYIVPIEYSGKTLTCKACSKSFRLPNAVQNAPVQSTSSTPPPKQAKPAQASPQASLPASRVDDDSEVYVAAAVGTVSPGAGAAAANKPASNGISGNCGVCQCEIEPNEPAQRCRACSGVYHTECWDYNHGCANYGCSEAPPTEGLNSLEIPPSHWGQEDKHCPQCTKMIKAAAVRCRHCGAIFETANPQDRQAFQSQQANQEKLPVVKTVAVVLLVFGLLPCTSPFVAVIGTIWYFMNRKTIALLPPFHSALCKIAIGVSIAITFLMVVFAIFHSFFSS